MTAISIGDFSVNGPADFLRTFLGGLHRRRIADFAVRT